MIADRNKLNRTGRKRLGLKNFTIYVLDGTKTDGFDDGYATFSFEFMDEARRGVLREFNPDSVVFVEVYDGPVRETYRFGTLGSILSGMPRPGDRKTGDRIPLVFATDTNFRFNVKIVNPETKIILASELKVHATAKRDDSSKKTLLPTHLKKGMGNQLWTVEFEPTGPVLFVNKDFVQSLDALPPLWKASVLPAALHRVLTYGFLLHKGEDRPTWAWREDSGGDWKTFVETTLRTPFPYSSSEEADNDEEAFFEKTEKWIDDAVESFAAFLQDSGISFKKLIKCGED